MEIQMKLIVFSLVCLCYGQAAKILVLFPHASESHFAVMRTLVTELASREHNVTVYTGHGLGEHLENVTETIIPEYPFWSNLQKHAAPKGNLADLGKLSTESLRKSLAVVGANALDHFLSQEPLQRLLKQSTVEFDFDVIILDYFYTEALLALGHFHQKPIVGIVSTDFGNYMEAVQESMVPAACSPIEFDHYIPTLGFSARLGNIRECIARRKRFAKDHFGAQEQLIAKHFKLKSTVPELQANQLSLLLLNSHVPLMTPRPSVQQIVPAGGLHIRGPRELPWNIKRFLEEARAGAIYLQLGNEQPCGQLPKLKLEALFAFFAARKERFIWSCHDVKALERLPKNVMIQHAVPQIDILAHPRVKAFIMNGDLLSLQEGIVRNVPTLGLPIFQNERQNMDLAVKLGVGLKLEQDNVTAASLSWAADRLLQEPQYQVTIRDVSLEFRDRPLGALASAMFWVNYVARHKGGAAIRTRGVGISSTQLHLFDLFLFYFGVASFFVGLLVALCFVAIFVWKKKISSKNTKLN
ncbi:UDP-glucuronosyltransferase 2A3 [Drosophila subobscura]|uniref:UDP-glucuronosyltransferase 2A3 n=1 Tax=Drosophila subobscura TaxID=7241 RepID=UPI00155B3D3B|nr:UDP-glucuronosyltransferase 2A3 [Drosophila subobscura]